MKRPIKLATVGAGYFSRFHYNAWSRIPEVEITAICNRDIAGTQEIADQHNIKQRFDNFELMLDTVKPDLVDIITPPVTHIEYVSACINRNIPVICQKPFTPSLEDAISLTKKAEANNSTIIIHENFRFQPWYLELKKLLDEEKLGDLYQITFRLRTGDGQGPEAYLERQPYFQDMERFLIHETGIHFIDVFRYLFGEITSLYADLRKVNPVIKGEDAGLVIFNFGNTTRGILDANRLSDHQAKDRRLTLGEMEIEGSLGTLSLNGDGQIFLRNLGENVPQEIEYSWNDNDFAGDCVYLLQKHVINYLLYDDELMNSASEYLKNIEIADSVYTSNLQNKLICIDKT